METPPSSTIANDVQLEAEPVVLDRGGEAEGVENACEGADDSGDDEEEQLDPLDANAGVERGVGVLADHEQRASERRQMQATPKITARTRKNTIDHERNVFPTGLIPMFV